VEKELWAKIRHAEAKSRVEVLVRRLGAGRTPRAVIEGGGGHHDFLRLGDQYGTGGTIR